MSYLAVAAPTNNTEPYMSYVASDFEKYYGKVVGDGECVAFVRTASTAPQSTTWKRGVLVKGTKGIKRGTAIATFLGDLNTYPSTRGQHAAIFLEETKDGLLVADQYSGKAVGERTLRFGNPKPVNDGNIYYVIE